MANETRQPNRQDQFLNKLRKEKREVTIHIVNGYQLNPVKITGYDNFVIMAEAGGKETMIYKHAVSTVTPEGTAQKQETCRKDEQ